jgi:cytochrome P450
MTSSTVAARSTRTSHTLPWPASSAEERTWYVARGSTILARVCERRCTRPATGSRRSRGWGASFCSDSHPRNLHFLQVAFTQYGDQSRRQRKLMTRALGASSIKRYHPLIELETRSFLQRLVARPQEWSQHVARCVCVFLDGLALWRRDARSDMLIGSNLCFFFCHW